MTHEICFDLDWKKGTINVCDDCMNRIVGELERYGSVCIQQFRKSNIIIYKSRDSGYEISRLRGEFAFKSTGFDDLIKERAYRARRK